MAASLGLINLVVVSTLLIASCHLFGKTEARYVNNAEEDVVKRAMEYVNRDKRYTDTQERASSFCTGMCMYEERKAYSDCFDLCNWNGRGPSPWNQLSKSKSDFDNSIDGVGAMIRTGGKSKPSSDKLKVKQGRSWSNGY